MINSVIMHRKALATFATLHFIAFASGCALRALIIEDELLGRLEPFRSHLLR